MKYKIIFAILLLLNFTACIYYADHNNFNRELISLFATYVCWKELCRTGEKMKTENEMKFDTEEIQKIYSGLKKAKSIIEQLMNMKNLSDNEQIEVIKKAKAFLH